MPGLKWRIFRIQIRRFVTTIRYLQIVNVLSGDPVQRIIKADMCLHTTTEQCPMTLSAQWTVLSRTDGTSKEIV